MLRVIRRRSIAKRTKSRIRDTGIRRRKTPSSLCVPHPSLNPVYHILNPMTDQFVNRHNGPNAQDVQAMLKKINAPSLDALIDQTVPAAIRLEQPLNLPDGM